MTCEPDTPDTVAEPPAGAIQRMAAEMLDVLAEHLDEQPANLGLTDLLARSGEGAVDAHGLAPNPWIRDGIETAALLGLAITAVPPSLGQLGRDQLAARFGAMTARQQRTWIINAADVLHRSNAIGSYGPPLGKMLTRRGPQAERPAVTARPASQAATAARLDHAHEEGLYIQLLPACLAPADADRAGQADLALPGEGDPVVIARGQVMFLTACQAGVSAARETTDLWGAPIIAEGCGGARWDRDSVTVLDPSYVGLQDADAEAIETAWLLLIDLARRFPAGGESR